MTPKILAATICSILAFSTFLIIPDVEACTAYPDCKITEVGGDLPDCFTIFERGFCLHPEIVNNCDESYIFAPVDCEEACSETRVSEPGHWFDLSSFNPYDSSSYPDFGSSFSIETQWESESEARGEFILSLRYDIYQDYYCEDEEDWPDEIDESDESDDDDISEGGGSDAERWGCAFVAASTAPVFPLLFLLFSGLLVFRRRS